MSSLRMKVQKAEFEKKPVCKIIEEHHQVSVAVRAAQHRARPPVMAAISGLNISKCRIIYKDVTGNDPNKGPLPSDTSYFVSAAHIHIESAWLAQAYWRLAKDEESIRDQVESLFLAYELYLQEFVAPSLTFDRVFLLTRHLHCGDITIARCNACGGAPLQVKSYNPKRNVKCPVCCMLN